MPEQDINLTEEEMLENTSTDEMKNMYLNFCVADETYSIEIRYVHQIVVMQEINEMPEMPHYMKGFINLRGNIIPVVSMRVRFHKEEIEYTDRTCIVVTQVADNEVGLIVDAIRETLTIEPEDIAPPPTSGDYSGVGYVTGVAKLGEGKTSVVINLQSLFAGSAF
ncbi:MAG: chemotaxis protein CheW [Oscillospiraceae bacterium]|jgi:purine-binding chemotaxis protein CheW|nr:chemotaxis protein CheW [Oscillospiraceae bacterium]